MSIYVIGINHKTASVSLREKIYFAFDKLSLYLKDLLDRELAREAVVLSTCNRSEIYCEADNIDALRDWFCSAAPDFAKSTLAALYIYRDAEAIAHIMEVACGLDSMILGEPQILGQMKAAFSESCSANMVDTLFHRIFAEVFALAKEVRTATDIGACPVSVASSAIHFIKGALPNFNDANILLIGAGETCSLLLRYLCAANTRQITVLNRNREHAAALAMQFSIGFDSLNNLNQHLSVADVIFTATGSPIPLVTINSLTGIARKKSLIFMDIAVPRDVAPEVAELSGVQVYCIDNLKEIIKSNMQGREHAAEKALAMIKARSKQLHSNLLSVDKIAHTIRAYRGQIEEICQAELIKAKHKLYQGIDPENVLDAFARAFTQKLLHTPSVQLRQAGVEGRFELLRVAKQLFAIPDA